MKVTFANHPLAFATEPRAQVSPTEGSTARPFVFDEVAQSSAEQVVQVSFKVRIVSGSMSILVAVNVGCSKIGQAYEEVHLVPVKRSTTLNSLT